MDGGGSDPSGIVIVLTLLFTLGTAVAMCLVSGYVVKLIMDRVPPDPRKLEVMRQRDEHFPGPYVSNVPGDPRSRLPHEVLFEIESSRMRGTSRGG